MGPRQTSSEENVDNALAGALVATADVLRDAPPADAARTLDEALDAYRDASDGWRDVMLAKIAARAAARCR